MTQCHYVLGGFLSPGLLPNTNFYWQGKVTDRALRVLEQGRGHTRCFRPMKKRYGEIRSYQSFEASKKLAGGGMVS